MGAGLRVAACVGALAPVVGYETVGHWHLGEAQRQL
jgi:hypothetical protein